MEKTYVFNQDGAGGASNGLLASILPSLQNRGIDTGYLMGLMNGGGGNGGFFGNNGGFQDITANRTSLCIGLFLSYLHLWQRQLRFWRRQ